MSPVTIKRAAAKDMMSERPVSSRERGKQQGEGKAIMNWPTSDPKVNSKVLDNGVRLVGSSRIEAVVCEPANGE